MATSASHNVVQDSLPPRIAIGSRRAVLTPPTVYLRVQAALKQLPDVGMYLDEVVAVGQNDPLVTHLRTAVPSGRREQGLVTTMYLPEYSPEDGATATVVLYRLAPSIPA